jgi:hypothetical protein
VVSKEKETSVSNLIREVLDLKKIRWTTKDFKNLLLIQEVNLLIEEMMRDLLRTTTEKEGDKSLEVIMEILNLEIKVLKWREISKVETEEALMVKEEMIIKREKMKTKRLSMERISKFQR